MFTKLDTCPECDTKTKDQSQFFNHVTTSHQLAKDSLKSIKQEPSEHNATGYTFNCDQCHFLSTNGTDIIHHITGHKKKELRVKNRKRNLWKLTMKTFVLTVQ